MTRALPQTQTINDVQQALTSLGGRQRWYGFVARALRVFWLTLLLAMSFILIDAAFVLPGSARLGMAIAAGAFCLIGLIAVVPWRGETDEQVLGDARRVERKGKLKGNPIINALFLSGLAESAEDPLARALSARCVERGRDAIGDVDQHRVLNRKPMRREAGWLWTAVVLWIVVLMIQPGLVTRGFLRMTDPFGGHAPFSTTQIDVEVNPDVVYEGDDAVITATIDGTVPDKVDLVELDDAGNEINRTPMTPADLDALADRADAGGESEDDIDGAFEKRLRNLTEPATYRVEAGRAQSAPVTIEPQPRESSGGADAGEDDANGNGEDSQGAPESNDRQGNDPGRTEPNVSDGGDLANQFPELFERLDELARMSQALNERANELMNNMPQPGTEEYEQWQRDMEDLQNQLPQFQQMARELAEMARGMAQMHPPCDGLLTRMALQLDQLAMAPAPGSGQGTTPGAGGAGGSPSGGTGNWLQGFSQSADRNTSQINEMMMQLNNLLSSMPSDGQADTMPWKERAAVGRAMERIRSATPNSDQPDAFMQKVPVEYRPLTGRYFDRVNADDR